MKTVRHAPLFLLLLVAPQADNCEEYVQQMRAEHRVGKAERAPADRPPLVPVAAPASKEPTVVIGADLVLLKEEFRLPDGREVVGITPLIVEQAVPASGLRGATTVHYQVNGKEVRTEVRP